MSPGGQGSGLDVSLEELRRRYDDEERRRTSVDNKIGGLLALDGILVTLIGLSGEISSSQPIWHIVTLVLLGGSLFICATQLLGREYQRPVNNLNWYVELATWKPEDATTEFLFQYVESIEDTQEINDKRYIRLRFGLLLTGAAIVIFLFGAVGGFELLASSLTAPPSG